MFLVAHTEAVLTRLEQAEADLAASADHLVVDEEFPGAPMAPDVRFAFDDLPMRLRMVETGHAAALLPDLAPVRVGPAVTAMALPGDPVRRISTAVRRGTATHPVSIALRQALRDAAEARQPRRTSRGT